MSAQRCPDGSGEGRAGLTVRVAPAPGHVVVSVTGEIDTGMQQAFRDALMGEVEELARGRLVVDLSGVGFMAAAGVHVLLMVSELLAADGGSLVVAGAQPVVARVLSLTGVDQVIPVAKGIEQALTFS
jgi:anti-sigma B factor antagonist